MQRAKVAREYSARACLHGRSRLRLARVVSLTVIAVLRANTAREYRAPIPRANTARQYRAPIPRANTARQYRAPIPRANTARKRCAPIPRANTAPRPRRGWARSSPRFARMRRAMRNTARNTARQHRQHPQPLPDREPPPARPDRSGAGRARNRLRCARPGRSGCDGTLSSPPGVGVAGGGGLTGVISCKANITAPHTRHIFPVYAACDADMSARGPDGAGPLRIPTAGASGCRSDWHYHNAGECWHKGNGKLGGPESL